VVAQLAERLANKVLHQALTGLKGYAEHPDRDVALRVAEALFGVEESARPSPSRAEAPRADHPHSLQPPPGESGRS